MRVVLNTRLRDEIFNNIKAKFNVRIQAAAEKVKSAQVSKALYDSLFTPEQHAALGVLPDDLLPVSSNMYFTYKGEKFEMAFSPARVIPSRYRMHYNSGTMTTLPDNIAPIFDEFIAIKTAVKKERDDFIEHVRGMMSSCVTLNQFVQVWPSVTEFCDKDTLERLNRKIERFKPESIEVPDEAKLAIAKLRMV